MGRAVDRLRTRRRHARAELFRAAFALDGSSRVLDLGGGDGAHIKAVLDGSLVQPANVCVADIDAVALRAAASHGFEAIVIPESGRLPFADRCFDVVFCSSVIEHATVAKDRVWDITAGSLFRSLARTRQRELAAEIRRVGKGYFVQVPYRWFPIESHSWLPFLSYLPRRVQVPLLRLSNRLWIKQTIPDFALLTEADLRSDFPDARILRERFCGLTKSLIALRVQKL